LAYNKQVTSNKQQAPTNQLQMLKPQISVTLCASFAVIREPDDYVGEISKKIETPGLERIARL